MTFKNGDGHTNPLADSSVEKKESAMNAITKLLGRPLCSDLLVAKIAQIACYVIAIGIFVLAILKLTTLTLTEQQLFFGILQVLAVVLMMICAGSLVRIDAEVRNKNVSNGG